MKDEKERIKTGLIRMKEQSLRYYNDEVNASVIEPNQNPISANERLAFIVDWQVPPFTGKS